MLSDKDVREEHRIQGVSFWHLFLRTMTKMRRNGGLL